MPVPLLCILGALLVLFLVLGAVTSKVFWIGVLIILIIAAFSHYRGRNTTGR